MHNEKNPKVDLEIAARLSGLNRDMLTYLGRIDVLSPSGTDNPGRGRKRKYTFADVVFLKAIAALLKQDISVKRLGKALKMAKARADRWIDIRKAPSRYLVTDGTDVLFSDAGQLESQTFNGQYVFGFVIDLGKIHRSIAEAWPPPAEASEPSA